MPKLTPKHTLAIRWFHWINFPVLMLMIWSGLLIYWANDIYSIRFGSHQLIKLFPEWLYHPHELKNSDGDVVRSAYFHLDHRLALGMAWHFFLMWLFALNGAAYVLYTAISGEWRLLVPGRHTIAEAIQVVLHDLKIRKDPLPARKFNGAQQIAYTMVVLMGACSLITGAAIYKPTQIALLTTALGGYKTARFIHFWLTMGYVGFLVMHITQVVRAGWSNFAAMITGFEVSASSKGAGGASE